MNSEITQIGAIVIVVQAAFKFGEMIINKYTGNGSRGIRDRIDELKENHIHELGNIVQGSHDIMFRIDRRTEEMNNKLVQIVELLKLLNQRK